MTTPRPIRVYLAGPEVFLPDPISAGRRKCALAERHGVTGLYPLDAALNLQGLGKHEQARRISEANESLMRSADALIANLTPFRGVSMDCGTAFEVGFMRALGRPVFGYTNVVADYAKRCAQYRLRNVLSGDGDRSDIQIEDFDHAENLMIACAIEASGSTIVRTSVPPGDELEDLSGFSACLIEVAKLGTRMHAD